MNLSFKIRKIFFFLFIFIIWALRRKYIYFLVIIKFNFSPYLNKIIKLFITIFEILICLKSLILISQIIIDPFPHKQKAILGQCKKHFHILLKKSFDNFTLVSRKGKRNKMIYFMNISDPGGEIFASSYEETGIRGPVEGGYGGRVDVFVLAVK